MNICFTLMINLQYLLNIDCLFFFLYRNNPLLFSRSLVAKNWTWYFPPEKIKNDIKLLAQIRYHQSPVSCTVISRSNGRYFVEFETPQRAIAPGQVVVIWDNNWCLGSGVIEYAL